MVYEKIKQEIFKRVSGEYIEVSEVLDIIEGVLVTNCKEHGCLKAINDEALKQSASADMDI